MANTEVLTLKMMIMKKKFIHSKMYMMMMSLCIMRIMTKAKTILTLIAIRILVFCLPCHMMKTGWIMKPTIHMRQYLKPMKPSQNLLTFHLIIGLIILELELLDFHPIYLLYTQGRNPSFFLFNGIEFCLFG